MDGLNASDVALLNRDNDWGGNSFMWIFALLILAGGGFGFNRGDYGTYATASSQQEILFGQQFQNLDNKIDRLGYGIADSTYALNNAITTEGRGLQKNVDQLRYDMANQISTVNATTTMMGQKILDTLAQNKIETLQGRINQLELQNAMCGVVKYPNGWTYNAGTSPFCNCNGCCGA